MPEHPLEASPILAIYLQIAQYPIMAQQIRHRMREELYHRGMISPKRFEQEAREKAMLSQHREGLTNPLYEEDARQWEQRLEQIRDHLTDFYFAYNLPLELFQRIVDDLLAGRRARQGQGALTFNPELAPPELLLRQAEQYEALPEAEQAKVKHHLEEIVVVLIKTMISDQLGFVRIAKSWFKAADFNFIQSRRIGSGKIGGKAGGLLLGWKILQTANPPLAERATLPRSYFVGADVFYEFTALNDLEYINQKYKTPEQISAEYPAVQEAHLRARFPEVVAERLRDILREVGPSPLIVRSSSLLEDNFGTSFAGKYASFFCANQGAPKENLRDLTVAIRRIYASVYSPDALLYRRHMGLLDYDERMAILLQEVQGQAHRRYFFPAVAGVAFGYSPIAWNPRLRREEGFVRMVLGLGTRAVERVADDHPRLAALSHPTLRPETTPAAIRRYSQRFADVIDLAGNALTTVPVRDLLGLDYPHLPWVAAVDQGDTVLPLFSLGPQLSPDQLVLTFDNLLQRGEFVPLLKNVLATLNHHYQVPVDVEFAVTFSGRSPERQLTFHLLQCRPQSHDSAQGNTVGRMPENIPLEDQLFAATRMAPQGQVSGVDYIVHISPAAYGRMADPARRHEVGRIVGRLNKALEGHNFILIGPGRWGSANIQLGVQVSYADIYNARALIELAVPQQGITPEPSYGTHFFQDLVEAQIYPLTVYPEEAGDYLNREFIERARNCLAGLAPEAETYADCIKVIHVPAERHGQRLDILMDNQRALAYFVNR
ncbi:MAG: PEP/pyruvate-binding domain-containing protein [Chloroflexi bacterium]|nr:PEP/pyruvate-binding domain-containing protein [Chloroflexota bacterium]